MILSKKLTFPFIIIFLLFCIFLGCIICESNKNQNINNPYFFPKEITKVNYDGYFIPLSSNEIRQNIILNINPLQTFEEGTLFTLSLDQLDVSDPFDKIAMGRDKLGYFYVTEEAIYRMHLTYGEAFTDEENNKIIESIKSNKTNFLKNWDIVCCENGTIDTVDEKGWHNYIEVFGNKRIFHFYNDYTSGTRYYEQIIWEKNKGIIYYKSGSGSMLMHIEFGLNLNKDNN